MNSKFAIKVKMGDRRTLYFNHDFNQISLKCNEKFMSKEN